MLQRLLIGFCFFRSSYRKLSITISIVVVLCFTCSLLFEIEYAPKKLVVYKHVRFDEKHECVENATTSYNGAKNSFCSTQQYLRISLFFIPTRFVGDAANHSTVTLPLIKVNLGKAML